jgi:hypothetical protein
MADWRPLRSVPALDPTKTVATVSFPIAKMPKAHTLLQPIVRPVRVLAAIPMKIWPVQVYEPPFATLQWIRRSTMTTNSLEENPGIISGETVNYRPKSSYH